MRKDEMMNGFEAEEPIKLDCSCEICNPGNDYQITEIRLVNSYSKTVKIKVLTCGDDECTAMALFKKIRETKNAMYVDTDRVMSAEDWSLEYGDRQYRESVDERLESEDDA